MSRKHLKELLSFAVKSRASDLHVKQDVPVALRIDGDLVRTDFMPTEKFIQEAITYLVPEDLLSRYNKEGDLDLSHFESGVGRFRVNVHRQKGTQALTIRYVKSEIQDFAHLGLPEHLVDIASIERGIVFLTGTTGSGKSTTLASLLDYINKRVRKKIITIEDPIEYEFVDKLSFVEQREVGVDTDSFENALIHTLRQDPDIIVIGEMRSRESFDVALQAADTGHLVFSTLHTINASQSINRILDFYDFSEHDSIRFALANDLAAIVSQRLLPKVPGPGVVPAVEIMINTPIIKKLLNENKLNKLSYAIESGTIEGMQSFNQSLMELMNKGLIAEEDAFKASSNKEALKMLLKGIHLRTDDTILGD